MLKSYLKKVSVVANRGDAREESYYSSLEGLLKEYAGSIDKKIIHITTLPKKTEAGNPDFRIWDGNQHIVGYIEAKAPIVEYLDQIQTTEQLKLYLTNTLEMEELAQTDLPGMASLSEESHLAGKVKKEHRF